MFCIEYTHEKDGVLYHGTLRGGGSGAASSWTIDVNGQSSAHEVPLDEDTFMDLWNGCNDLEIFKTNQVKKKSTPKPEPSTHHLVAITFQTGKDKKAWRYDIPAADVDDAFGEWIAKLSVPTKDG